MKTSDSLSMTKQKKLILFDIDHTLFDTKHYLTTCFETIGASLHVQDKSAFIAQAFKLYREKRKLNYFQPEQFLEDLLKMTGSEGPSESLQFIFTDETIINNALYPDVENTLKTLSTQGILLGVFSAGHDSLQRLKIKSISHLLEEEHIHILEVKNKQETPLFVEKYATDVVCLVDDLPEVLKAMKKKSPAVTTILIDRDGKYRDEETTEIEQIDFTLANLGEILTIIQ